jgi:hypothetical protein
MPRDNFAGRGIVVLVLELGPEVGGIRSAVHDAWAVDQSERGSASGQAVAENALSGRSGCSGA